EGTKVLNGRKLEAEKFTFALSEGREVLRTAVNAEDGSFKFDPIEYTTANIGIHTYKVQEVTPETDGNGYIYDRTIYAVVVEVSDNGDGTLNVDVRKENDKEPELKFTNTYEAKGKTSVTATKVLTGTNLKENQFSFTLESTGIAPAYKETVKNALNGTISFPEMNYTEADAGQTYTYLMYEEIPTDKAKGYTYDETVYHVEVTITDNGDGHLTTATKIYEVSGPAGRPVKTEVEKAQFTNAYHAEGTLNLTAQKNLTGRLLADGQFAFILKSKEVKEGETAISQRKTNDLNGQITFDPISYTEQDLGKTYTYLLYEEIPAEKADGYTYDETIYEVWVTPKDNGDGTINAEYQIVKSGTTVDGEIVPVEKAVFHNVYNAYGELTLTATKLLIGRTIEDGQFTFTLTGPKTEDQSKSNVGTQVTFDPLKYDESDAGKDYVYTIREEIPTDKQPGYTYDESIYEVTVSVRDQGNGKLNAAVSDITKITTENEEKKTEKADAVAFVNTYKATGETSISAEKILKGRTIADKQFSFTLKGDPANEANGDTNKDQTVKNVGKNVTFANLTYTEKNAGKTYTYYLQEVVPDMEVPGYGFDNTVHTVEVTVTDNGDGTLKVEKTIDGKTVEASKDDETKTPDAVFTNTYSAEGGIVLTASKTYAEGVQKSLLQNEYQFVVLENGNEVATGTNALDGKITFSKISYKLTPDDTSVLGEHTYTVKETKGTDGAVLYDEAEYTVKVKVSDDGSGILKAEVVGDTKEADLKFVNDLTKVKVSKIDVTNNTELPGAKLEIRDADGEVIDSWISGSEPHYIEGILKAGQKYTLTETAVPNGYKYAEEITFEVGKDGKVQTVTMKDTPSKLTVSKKDMADLAENLPGATFEVQDENGDVVRTVYNETLRWTTTEDALVKTIIGLKDGSYKLVETKAPTGYTIADPISFTVEKGKIYRSVDGEQAEIDTIAMEDQATEVMISKTDITTGKELPGATLQILKKVKAATDAGEEAEKEEIVITIYGEKLEWVSGEKPKTIKGLPAGEYILRETAAPNGYTIAKDVKFTVTDELKAAETVVMENAPIEVNISKTDITTDKELPGATLQILKKAAAVTDDGEETETEEVVTTIYGEKLEWVSTGEPKNIKGLPAGDYILRETAAPDGYTVAADVEFTITDELKAAETVVIKDAPIVTSISKVDITTADKELPGATLQILKKVTAEDGTTSEVIAATVYGEELQWTSGEKAKEIKGLPAGDYILREIAAPSGYTIAKDVAFTVSDDSKVTNKAVMKDQATEVNISKVDITNAEKELPGATLQVMDKYGNEIVKTVYGEELKWVSGTEVKVIKGLPAGEYTLREISAPAGYSIAKDVKFTITDELKAAETVVMKDAAIEATISKVDITNAEKELPGAELQIMDAEGKEVVKTIFGEELKWTSAETAKQIKGLPAGEYILRETKAPAGFAVAADVKFTISDDLTVENKVVMKDAPTDVTISKVAISNEARELPGAALEILDEKGEIAKTVYGEQLSWISDVTAKVIKGLPAGTYTLRETAAPDGYALAEDVTFTVNTDGTTTKVVMKDDVTRVQISKMDVTNNKELAGAHLALKDASGEIILNWISTGEPKVFEGKLIAGATYTLTEISAPSGYSLAKDITFTVNSNKEIQKIVMDDKVASGDASVIVQKLVKYKDQYKTIDDYTFYTALFADEACTQRVSSVKALRVQQSYTTSTIFTNLEYGTYYVAETDEFGNPISESFVIDSNEILDGKVSLTPKSQMGKSTIINYVNGNLPENPYNDGKITVNKQVLIGTEPGNVTDTFYFALFTDAAHTVLASADIQKLELNDESSGTVVFDRLPYGEYYLAETDEDGMPVDSDFGYTVTLDASYCKISSDSTAVERTITNSKKKEPDTEPVTEPTTTPTTTPTTNPPTNTTTTKTTPKTGDDTNIAFYLTLMMMAALVGTGYGVRRRKKKEQK
ncbi:MAG: LPXTG cell wall anchor domain-containing protein, partial [Lachnospiraceae bacterium]|nr:LPXTG cell wall anchor domain-containing protein [Lachnospiraceae bacterium]